ncbi:hypothetical protein HNQ60_000744 [Povalibacter uvarum]|uniref:Uncharacterized protein n=1 Tax=Povalibacter uvarum TaxID=732238 RepID=A0A841HI19_9GAMM|nr:hypothetical protein [Povalibacter uvarum]MBB6091898.1 hypothetical protein [Povalibacter uvarum]
MAATKAKRSKRKASAPKSLPEWQTRDYFASDRRYNEERKKALIDLAKKFDDKEVEEWSVLAESVYRELTPIIGSDVLLASMRRHIAFYAQDFAANVAEALLDEIHAAITSHNLQERDRVSAEYGAALRRRSKKAGGAR